MSWPGEAPAIRPRRTVSSALRASALRFPACSQRQGLVADDIDLDRARCASASQRCGPISMSPYQAKSGRCAPRHRNAPMAAIDERHRLHDDVGNFGGGEERALERQHTRAIARCAFGEEHQRLAGLQRVPAISSRAEPVALAPVAVDEDGALKPAPACRRTARHATSRLAMKETGATALRTGMSSQET